MKYIQCGIIGEAAMKSHFFFLAYTGRDNTVPKIRMTENYMLLAQREETECQRNPLTIILNDSLGNKEI